jgi:eukaryotic-like serine/threonine-protein kinase
VDESSFPTRVGPYELVLPIASGGMATVYLARQHGLAGFEREVALKLMHPHLRDEKAWNVEFIEEAKLSARIRHPNVVQVLDVGDDPFGTYLVMDYVEGDTLARLARAAREQDQELPREVAMRVLCDALSGLHAAHELRDERGFSLGVVHRDFSPQNVLVGIDGITRLADFGIAKASTRVTHTQTGSIKGKVAYMSPEQARGESVDRRADVWAAGVVAWEILARRRLFPVGDPLAIGLKLITERPPRLREIDSSISRALDEAVASALEPRLDARCATADALRTRLMEALDVAELSEVAAWVARLCEAPLAERRTRAAEVRKLRTRLSAVQRGDDDPTIVTPEFTPPPETMQRALEEPERKSKRGIWIGLAVLAIAGTGGAVYAMRPAPTVPSATPDMPLPAFTPPPPIVAAPPPTPIPTPSVVVSAKPPVKKVKPVATPKTKPLAPNPYE